MKKTSDDSKIVATRFELVKTLLDSDRKAEKVLINCNLVNVITKEIYEADVAIEGEYILMIGDCKDLIGDETVVFDLTGKYITPGFIDSHMHFESAMLTITEFTRLSLPTGTTCLVSDPHEIGNVLGPKGIMAMTEEAALMPQHVYCRVPALTPDSPGLETAGYDIRSNDIPEMLGYKTVTGIGETQGISAIKHVYKHNIEVIEDTIKSTVFARSNGYGVDGNAPELSGKYLAAHIIAAGTDISCHETTTKKEAIEKLRNGVYVLMREGSTQRNMPECVRAFTEEGFDSRRAILATDDMLAEDILAKGHMNDIIRRTISEGVDPIEAIQMATINASTWLGLDDIGIIAPGKLADIAVISGDIRDMNVTMVFLKGQLVAEDSKLLIPLEKYTYPNSVKNSVLRSHIKSSDLEIESDQNEVTVRCIGLIPDQNLTNAVEVRLQCEAGFIKPRVEKDILPIAVVGRYGQDCIGRGFVRGFQLNSGAIAESVSHDTHNIIVVGASYEDMAVAVNHVITMQGGVALVNNGAVIGELPLRIAGLMTDELCASELTQKMKELNEIASSRLKCGVHAPFMHLAFLSLSTSAKWKITDKGLVDAENYCIIPTVITEKEEKEC